MAPPAGTRAEPRLDSRYQSLCETSTRLRVVADGRVHFPLDHVSALNEKEAGEAEHGGQRRGRRRREEEEARAENKERGGKEERGEEEEEAEERRKKRKQKGEEGEK